MTYVRKAFGNNILSFLVGLVMNIKRIYDLMILVVSEKWTSRRYLFGCISDQIAGQAGCSVLMVRREESVMMNWLRRQVKWITENNIRIHI